MSPNTCLEVKAALFHAETGVWPLFKDAQPQEEPGQYEAWISKGNGRIVQWVLMTVEELERQRHGESPD